MVRVRVEVFDERPEVQPGWEEVVETSFTFAETETELVLTGYGGDVPIQLPAVGTYRIRYGASGMDEARARVPASVDDLGPDRYLLQLWLEPSQPDVIIRVTSAAAIEEHEVSRRFLAPPRRPDPRAPELA